MCNISLWIAFGFVCPSPCENIKCNVDDTDAVGDPI